MDEAENGTGYLMFRGAEWVGVASLAVCSLGAAMLVSMPAIGYVVLGLGGTALLVVAAGGKRRRRSAGTRAVAELLLFVGWAAWLVMLAATPFAVRSREAAEAGAFSPGPGLVAGWIVAPILFVIGMNLRIRWPAAKAVASWFALLAAFALTLLLTRFF